VLANEPVAFFDEGTGHIAADDQPVIPPLTRRRRNTQLSAPVRPRKRAHGSLPRIGVLTATKMHPLHEPQPSGPTRAVAA